MSLKKMDLYVFSFLSILSEFLSLFFFERLNSGFYLSFAFLLFLIISLRWGIVGIIPFVLSSIPSILLDKSISWYNGIIYYTFSNIFAVIPILIYTYFMKKKSRTNLINKPFLLFLYSLTTLLSLAIGKGLACLIINNDYKAILGYLTSMTFTFILSFIIIYGLSKLKNSIVVDMTDIKEKEV